jgi:uncharacterized membrane protein YqjE
MDEKSKQADYTFYVLCVLSATAALWEMWTIANNRQGDTFSATIKKLATGQPFIVLMTGMICGHLFWPLRDGED